MVSDGSFEMMDEISPADYQLAEQVAANHKNEEDAVSLALARADASSFDWLLLPRPWNACKLRTP